MHPDRHPYWKRIRRLTLWLLLIWFLVSFVLTFFARELSFLFFGWPFSFWMSAQGGLLVYAAIIAYYAWYMNRLDDEHGVEESATPEETNEH